MTDNLTASTLKEMKFRGPVRFLDGAKGWARQDYQAVDEPRFGYSWQRESRKDKGRQFYTVDGREVESLDDAAKLLTAAPDPDSPAERERRSFDAFMASPKLAGRATRAENDARLNADAVPFTSLRPWMQRADHPWHVGINRFMEHRDFAEYRWMYEAKSAAHETARLMYLHKADRENDTDLICTLGKRCRDCPILQSIETAMVEARSNPKFPREIEDTDIDGAKAWTCIMHIMHERAHPIDGGFVENASNRKFVADEAEHWADVERSLKEQT